MALEAAQLATYQMTGLPTTVSSPVDIGRLVRELERIDGLVAQASLRAVAGDAVQLPKTTQSMDRTVELNKLDLLQAADRERLRGYLEAIRTQSPILHISFNADPSAVFMEKLVAWLRIEIHPLVLVTIGLQPNIGAGCVVRSTNKYFDFSLRQDFIKHEAALREVLSPALAGKAVPA